MAIVANDGKSKRVSTSLSVKPTPRIFDKTLPPGVFEFEVPCEGDLIENMSLVSACREVGLAEVRWFLRVENGSSYDIATLTGESLTLHNFAERKPSIDLGMGWWLVPMLPFRGSGHLPIHGLTSVVSLHVRVVCKDVHTADPQLVVDFKVLDLLERQFVCKNARYEWKDCVTVNLWLEGNQEVSVQRVYPATYPPTAQTEIDLGGICGDLGPRFLKDLFLYSEKPLKQLTIKLNGKLYSSISGTFAHLVNPIRYLGTQAQRNVYTFPLAGLNGNDGGLCTQRLEKVILGVEGETNVGEITILGTITNYGSAITLKKTELGLE